KKFEKYSNQTLRKTEKNKKNNINKCYNRKKIDLKRLVIVQLNDFSYARFNMSVSEFKILLAMFATLDSVNQSEFIEQEVTTRELAEILQHEKNINNESYLYDIMQKLAEKTYFSDNGESAIAVPFFKYIKKQDDKAFLKFKFNDTLKPFLLELRRDFVKFNYTEIKDLRSFYSIRLYIMLLTELRQNRQCLVIDYKTLCDTLGLPRHRAERKDFGVFNQKILTNFRKDMLLNAFNVELLDIQTEKVGKKVDKLIFTFDYKGINKRLEGQNKRLMARYRNIADKARYLIGESLSMGKAKDFRNVWKIIDTSHNENGVFILVENWRAYRVKIPCRDWNAVKHIEHLCNTYKAALYTRLTFGDIEAMSAEKLELYEKGKALKSLLK
ncbi:replication initiation protein, partial [Helicobacter magdeburgensis]